MAVPTVTHAPALWAAYALAVFLFFGTADAQGYEYLFDGCCRGGARRWQYRGSFALSACEALCDSESDCIAIEVNGCLRNPSCPDRCYTFTGNTGRTITNGRCDTSGNQKCYQRPGAIVPDREDGFCVDVGGGDVNHGVTKHPNRDLPEAACLAWCLQQPGVLGCERIVVQSNKGCYWFAEVTDMPLVDHGNHYRNHWCWIVVADSPPPGVTVAPGTPADDYTCRTNIWVQYTQPAAGQPIGPIVLGRGANGAQISLYPGTLKVRADVYVCDGVGGAELDGVAYRGEATVAYTGVGAMSIIVYAVDVRTVLDLDPFVQNFAPLITSIQISPQTVNVGEAAMIEVTGWDFNDPDFLARLDLGVVDRTATSEVAITREVSGSETATLGFRTYAAGRTHSVGTETDADLLTFSEVGPFTFTPVAVDFTGSSEASHSLVAKVTGRDTLGAEGYGEIPFVVNRLDGVKIGVATFNRPRVSLNADEQSHVSVAQGPPAHAVFDIFDPDSETPPLLAEDQGAYVESHTYTIESIAAPVDADGTPIDIAPGTSVNNNNVPRPSNSCTDGACSYIPCACTAAVDDDGNVGCQEITATKVVLATGTKWTFAWNPWISSSGSEITSSNHGATFCALKVHFEDNTASASRTGDTVDGTTAVANLRTATASVLLQATPQQTTDLNYPPAISLFYAVHVDLEEGNTMDTTITVQYEDPESASRPGAQLGFLQPDCSDGPASCFEAFTDANAAPNGAQTDDVLSVPAGQAGAWQGVYTFNGNTALPDASGSTLKVYLKLVDATDASMVGYHEMATLTRLAARKRRRRQATGDAAAPRKAAMTIYIDEDGQMTGQMEFPNDAVVTADIDTAGGSTRAPDEGDDDRGDDHIRTDDGSSDRQLVIILALGGGVGCCCLLGAAICLGYAMLRRTGTASVGPSPTLRPTKILVSGAAPGLYGPRKDPFAGFQTA